MKKEDGNAQPNNHGPEGAKSAKGHDVCAEPHGVSQARHQKQAAEPLYVGRGAREQLKERQRNEHQASVLCQIAVASNRAVKGSVRISVTQAGIRCAPLATHEDHQNDVQNHDGAGGGGCEMGNKQGLISHACGLLG